MIPMKKSKTAAVLGAGVIGLSTGVRLLESGWRVVIYAREQTQQTTSGVAAAFWFPYKVERGPRVTRWALATRTTYQKLAEHGVPGITPAPLHVLRRQRHLAMEEVPGVRAAPLATERLPPGFAQGLRFEVMRVETPLYLPWLQAEFVRLGGVVKHREVKQADELLQEHDFAVHCSGVHAGRLAADATTYPIRGQIIRVVRPAGLPDTVLLHEEGEETTYIVPRSRDCILGGTAQKEDWNLAPDEATAAGIFARCVALEPRLQGVIVLEHKVGLRPGRSTVRLELESRPGGKAILHHYGHGGAGYTLAWGAADEAVERAKEWLG